MQDLNTPQWMIDQGFSKTFAKRFWEKVKKTESCWLWDAQNKGRLKNPQGFGEDSSNPSLSLHEVFVIRSLCGVVSNSDLAVMFGVDKKTIWNVVNHRTWSHVGVPLIRPSIVMESPLGSAPLVIRQA
jgi:hypothetical protein